VRGLLDYSRPRRLTPTSTVVADVLSDATRLLTDQGVLRRVAVTREIDADAQVFAERHELEQVIVNLLLNAADAMDRIGTLAVVSYRVEPGELEESVVRREGDPPQAWTPRRLSPRVRHWLETTQPTAILKLVVADSGPGIADEDAERVFDPFFTTKQTGQGTGLGLAIVARVVDDLRGTIWVERAREGGAAFHVLLPMAAASLTPVRPPDAGVLRTPGQPATNGAR